MTVTEAPVGELRRVVCGLRHRAIDGIYTEGFDGKINPRLLIVVAYLGSIVIKTISLLMNGDYSDS